MFKVVGADKKDTITHITSLYCRGEQKGILECMIK